MTDQETDYVSKESEPETAEETPKTDSSLPSWVVGEGMEVSMTDPNAQSRSQGSNRLWLPPGNSKKIVFLTDSKPGSQYGPITIYEHNLPLGQGKKRWQNWKTCLESLGGGCPYCEWAESHGSGFRYKATIFTVIDTSEFTDKGGKKRSNEKRMLVAKKDTYARIQATVATRADMGQTLRGSLYKVTRLNQEKSASVGDIFEFMKEVDLSSLADSDLFNYMEILAPQPDRVDAVIGQLKRESGEFGGKDDFSPPQEGADSRVEYNK